LGYQQINGYFGATQYFFSEDYAQEFKEIFQAGAVPSDPTIYVHISSKLNAQDAPKGCENWFVMVNVPAGVKVQKKQQEQIKALVIKRLEKALKTPIEPHIAVEKVWTPDSIEADTGALQGALYGAASNKKFSALTRHPNFSKKYKNLYFCGGTVHPGGGIPLVLKSAQIVDKLIADAD
jgi:phytoene dehydrogenase-like protein